MAALFACASALAGSLTYEYDTLGRLKRVTDSTGQQITYTLDPAGNRTQVGTAANTAGTLSLAPSSYAVTEGTPSITITVARTGGSTGAVSVSYATSDGTAIAGSDYTATSGVLSWSSADAASKTFTVPILDDSTGESVETFSVGLSNVSGGAALGTVTATVTITDNESAPSTPTGLGLLSGTNPIHTGNYTIKWNASTGSPSYYELAEDEDADGTVDATYTINAPAVSKAFSKGSSYFEFRYKVRACNASNQCSAWSNQYFLIVCGSGTCP